MSNQEIVVMEKQQSVSIIESVDINAVQQTMGKIGQFQKVVQETLRQNHDFGIVPGTKKPTLLKPGAEKLTMLLGLTTEFEIADSTRDFEKGFFQYQVICKLMKNGEIIIEGMGSCNTKETKYIKLDPFTMDNTVLKMAKKRALVDAALLVGALSDIFTQDLEDIDLQGAKPSQQEKVYTDNSGTITEDQAKRIFAIAKKEQGMSNEEILNLIKKYGYNHTKQIKKVDYDIILKEIKGEK